MAIDIGRRHFVVGLGGAAFGWPRSQSVRSSLIGCGASAGWWDCARAIQKPCAARPPSCRSLTISDGCKAAMSISIFAGWDDSIERNLTYSQELAALKPDVLVAKQHAGDKKRCARKEPGMPRRLFSPS